jgi:hypothetical protein
MPLVSCVYQVSSFSDFNPETAVAENSVETDGGRRLPDPRYRPPTGLDELDRVASMVAKASGGTVRGRIELGADPGPTCRVRGSADDGTIQVNPRASQEIPPNSWAFIFGHEFAHQFHRFGPHGATSPEVELQADIYGAEYARKAGFDLAAHLGWMFSRRNHDSDSHGDWHGRAEATARHYGISPGEIDIHVERYRRNHW